MSAPDKDAPRGALEEAVALFDELRALFVDRAQNDDMLPTDKGLLADLERRRAALEPRLARRGARVQAVNQACLHPVACKPCVVCKREPLFQLADELVRAIEYACEETTAIEGRDRIDDALAAYKAARLGPSRYAPPLVQASK